MSDLRVISWKEPTGERVWLARHDWGYWRWALAWWPRQPMPHLPDHLQPARGGGREYGGLAFTQRGARRQVRRALDHLHRSEELERLREAHEELGA